MFYANNPNSSPNNLESCNKVSGLEEFFKVIEKNFFAEVAIQGLYYDDSKKTDLIVELYCNFSIEDGLYHLKNGHWGTGSFGKNSDTNHAFQKAFQKVKKQNNKYVDIGELSIHFKDTSLVVAQTYNYSIPEQLDTLLLEISNHFIYFTKGISEIPYEIFVPVFEGNNYEFSGSKQNYISYFEYWGIYTEDEKGQEETRVYDLNAKKLHKEDFFLL